MQNDVYENVLRKGFHKTTLSLSDLFFQKFISQDLGVEVKRRRSLGLVGEKLSGVLCLSIVLFLVKYCSVYCCIKRFIGNKVKISFTISAVSSNRLKFIC